MVHKYLNKKIVTCGNPVISSLCYKGGWRVGDVTPSSSNCMSVSSHPDTMWGNEGSYYRSPLVYRAVG